MVISVQVKNRILSLYGLIFALYIGVGPIYWLPWVGLKYVQIVKAGIYFVIVFWPILYGVRFSKFIFPGGGRVFLLIVALFAFSVPSMLSGRLGDSLYRLQNIFQIFLLVFICGFLIRKNLIEAVVRFSVKIFVYFCLLSLFFMVFIPGYENPLNEQLILLQTGLGGSRTGWSPTIALYLPWLYTGLVLSGSWAWIGGLVLVANQVLVAGRAGFVAALVPYLVFGVSGGNYKRLLVMVVILTIIFFFAINNLQLLRLDVGGIGSGSALSELSTGRTDQYALAFELIAENPFIGAGIGRVKYGETSLLIHNVIVGVAAESGIPYSLIIVSLFAIALYRGWKGVVGKDRFVTSAFLTVLSGVVISFFEPLAMFGSFYSAGFWWLCFSICVSYKRPKANFDEFNKGIKYHVFSEDQSGKQT